MLKEFLAEPGTNRIKNGLCFWHLEMRAHSLCR